MTGAFCYPACPEKLGFLWKMSVYIKKEKTNAVKSPVYSRTIFLYFSLFHCIHQGVTYMEQKEIFQNPLLKSFTEKFNIYNCSNILKWFFYLKISGCFTQRN